MTSLSEDKKISYDAVLLGKWLFFQMPKIYISKNEAITTGC